MHQTIEAPLYPSLEQLYTKCYAKSVRNIAVFLHYIFNAGSDEINVNGSATTVLQFAVIDPDGSPTQKIVFWGGPEGNQDWYTGTLVTLLLDRYYYNLFEEDGDISSSLDLLRALK